MQVEARHFDRLRKVPSNLRARMGLERPVQQLYDGWRRFGQRLVVAPVLALSLLAAVVCFAHDGHDAGERLLGGLYPRLSADGGAIVFAYQGAIWRVAREGGIMTRLTRSAGYDTWPNWSPDGARIAYVNARGSTSGPLRLMSSSDGSEIELPVRPLAKDKLEFSPDGQRLLGLFQQASSFSLCWFDMESGVLGKELYADERGLRYSLSRDGLSIALITTQDVNDEQGGNNGPNCDVWIMPAAGGQPRKLVQFPGRIYDIAWSADGRSLLVVSNLGGAHNDLWQIPLDQPLRDAKKLTFGQADEDQPSMSSDGRWLLFTDNQYGPTGLIVRDLQNSLDSSITVYQREFGLPTGKLRLEMRDESTKALVTARVSLSDEHGKFHAPADGLYRMLGQDLHFYCEGIAELQLPTGKYHLKVARGPEYRELQRSFTIAANAELTQAHELERWTNQRSQGWYSGESHIHANYGYGEWYNSPRTMLAQSAGEDLIVSNFMVANSEADGVFDREYFRGGPDPLSSPHAILYWNEEFRSTIWGHMTLLNLKQLVEPIFTGFANTTHPHDHPTNADIADHTHDQHGHVNYTHPAQNVRDPYLSAYSAKALPLDVALGKVDSMDVLGANQQANMAIWYKLLNCGFRVPASAGTDCFLNRVRSRLPGGVRVYVKVEGAFTYERWIEALRAGKTFVTNGPMFEFKVDGNPAGSVIQLKQPGEVHVVGKVTAQYPLERVEIVSHGHMLVGIPVKPSSLTVNIDERVAVGRSGWIALRAWGSFEPERSGADVFGHTSPIYIDVQGMPADAKADAAYFVNWIDRLRTDIRKRNRVPGRHQNHVESQMAEARDIFQQLTDGPH